MSLENYQLDTLLAFQADLDLALSEKDWKKAHEIIDNCGDLGYENEARIMHQSLNRAKAHDANEQEDVAAGHEDPRDVADRTNF